MRFIFVGGAPRSGTTLVQKLLTSHSKVVGGPEFDHTRKLFSLYEVMATDFHLERQSFFYDRDRLTSGFRDFYQSFFVDALSRKPGAIFFSEKTPNNLDVAPTLLRVFPDSLFISVIRDGRDVLLSHQKVRDRAKKKQRINPRQWSVKAIASVWNRSIEQHVSLTRHPDLGQRVHTVIFEELLRQPRTELESMFEFLGVPLEDRLLNPAGISEADTDQVIDDVWYTKEMYRQGFNVDKIGQWKQELTPLDSFLANLQMASNLASLRYDVGPCYLAAHIALRSLRNAVRGLRSLSR